MQHKFEPGQIVATPGADRAISSPDEATLLLSRHLSGDYGEMDAEDVAVNEEAILHGGRIMSAYKTLQGVKVWIITEVDRSVTTFLLPDEY